MTDPTHTTGASSADVIDIRPDRFLRAMRDTGDWAASLKASGMSQTEAASLCREDRTFDQSVIECQLEYWDEHLTKTVNCAIAKLQGHKETSLQAMRKQAYTALNQRHPRR